jgi:Zn-dependent oligopeptidase
MDITNPLCAIAEARTGLMKSRHRRRSSFQNTIEALETEHKLKRLELIFYNINSAETSKEIQQIAQEVSPVLSAYYTDITS